MVGDELKFILLSAGFFGLMMFLRNRMIDRTIVTNNDSHAVGSNRPAKQIFGKRRLEVASPENARPRAVLKNREHPSYDVHECIDQIMRSTRDDWSQLTPVERNFLRAYEFDSRIMNGGVSDFFFYVNTPKVWEETANALEIIGANETAVIFRRMISKDGDRIASQSGDTDGEELSEDWGKLFSAARDGEDYLIKLTYFERLLDVYVRDNYSWAV